MAGIKLDDPIAAASTSASPGHPGVIEVASPTIVDPPPNILGLALSTGFMALLFVAILWLMIRFPNSD